MNSRIHPLWIVCVWMGLVAPLRAQTTNPPTFEVTVTPTDLTVMPSESTNAVFVKISNADLFTNIVVIGSFDVQTNIPFLDDGAAPDLKTNDGVFSGSIVTPFVTATRTVPLSLVLTGDIILSDPPPDPLPGPVSVTNRVRYVIVPRPANDNFTNAFKIAAAGDLVTGSNTFATLEPQEPQHARAPEVASSVWWFWPCTVSTNALIDLGGSAFDAVLGVYTGTSVGALTQVAAATNDVVHKLKAYVSFNAKAGSTYRIAVSGSNSNAMGDLRLRVAPGAQPDFTGPLVSITSPPSESLVTTEFVSFLGSAKERLATESGLKDVFLQINSDTSTQYVASVNPGGDWTAALPLPPGTNLVRAWGVDFDGNRGPSAAVVVRYLNPLNDMFSYATELADIGGVWDASTKFATKEPGEPLHAGNEGGHSIWYHWTAPRSGDLFLSTEGSDFDTVLALYAGTSLTNLAEIGSNDDAYSQSGFSELYAKVLAGQSYYFAVDGLGGDFGNAVFSYSFSSTEILYGILVSSSLGGVVLPANEYYPPGTAVSVLAVPDRNFGFVRWEDPSGNFISSVNPLPLVMNQNYYLEAKFRLLRYSDTFKTGNLTALSWSTVGAAPWAVTMVDGQYAARSGAIGNGQSSSLVLITNLYAGTGSFDVRTSSELDWDWLEFYLNGALMNRWSGETAWQSYPFAVTEGANVLEWRYVKDANWGAGLDAAFLDNVYLPLEKPNPPLAKPELSLAPWATGILQLQVLGQPNASYVIQGSTNLSTWTPLLTNQMVGASLQWVDPEASRFRYRFYRVLSP
jgi:hypothetical protein